MSSVGGVGGGITVGDMKNLDLESAMMLVQTRRAELLESQLVGRITELDGKNKQIANLNQMLSEVKHNRPTDPAGKATFGPQPENPERTNAIFKSMREAGIEGVPPDWKPAVAEVATPGKHTVKLKDGTTHIVDDAGKAEAEHAKSMYWAFRSGDYSGGKAVKSIVTTQAKVVHTPAQAEANKPSLSQKDYDTMVSKLTSAIEGLNSTQQMDMLKVQSLSNKRNEAFDVMTNFIKKMQDNRSSIIGNMR